MNFYLRYRYYLIGYLLLQTKSSDTPSWLPRELLKALKLSLVFISFCSKECTAMPTTVPSEPTGFIAGTRQYNSLLLLSLTCAHVSVTVYKRCRES